MNPDSIYDVAFICLKGHGWANSSLDVDNLLVHHGKMFFTLEKQQHYGMKVETEISIKKKTMSVPWAIPLNPKKGNIFEYVTCAILISLKYRKWQHELNWWMAFIISLPIFCFGMVYVISRAWAVVHLNSLPMYNVGDHVLSLDLWGNLRIFFHHVSVLYATYLRIIFC